MDGLSPSAPTAEVYKFLLVLIRCGTLFSIFPILSAKQIPNQVKAALSAFIAFLIANTLPATPVPGDTMALAGAVTAQILIGLTIGFIGTFIFAGIQFAGEVIDTQVGFAITNIINPMTQTSVTVLGQFELIMATLIFLITDSHHLLIEGMAGSFAVVPLPYMTVRPELMTDMALFFSMSLTLIFKIAIPIAVSLMITNIAMGLLARVAPQVNVFIVAFPAQIGIGMIMFGISLPLLAYVLPAVFSELPGQMSAALRTMAPAVVR